MCRWRGRIGEIKNRNRAKTIHHIPIRMKLLVVSRFDRSARAITTITNYSRAAAAMGHEVALFSEPLDDLPDIATSRDPRGFDYVMFVVYETADFPDLPHLAHLLDRTAKTQRIIVDCTGRFNETINVEHDFNHLEKMDNHQGWEWIDGFSSVAAHVCQPTLRPRRSDAKSFLFHGFNPKAITQNDDNATQAAERWAGKSGTAKPYGLTYVGNNWQRWTQMRSLLNAIKPIREQLGPICLAGWAWDHRPAWAAELGIDGINTDPALLQKLGVEIKWNVPFNQVTPFLNQGRFTPVLHRPLFNRLGLVTNRTFETFCADTVPLLILPEPIIESIYGPAARLLHVGNDVAGHIQDVIRQPEVYWDAILKTRVHLAQHHSFERRIEQLLELVQS
jgi:hypothetical protein